MDHIQVDYPQKTMVGNIENNGHLLSQENRPTDGERKKPAELNVTTPMSENRNGIQKVELPEGTSKPGTKRYNTPEQPPTICERRTARKIPALDAKTILGIGLSLETAKIKDGPQLLKPKIIPKSVSLENVVVTEVGPTERPVFVVPRTRRVSDVIDSLGNSSPSSPRLAFNEQNGGAAKSFVSDVLEKSRTSSGAKSTTADLTDSAPLNASEGDSVPMSDEDDENKVVYAMMPVEMHSEEYNMNHPRRGHAVVFNHDTFDHGYEPRLGSDLDAKALEITFRALDFQVTVHTNLTCSNIKKVIKQLKEEDHSDADCLVVIILSHGIQGGYVLSKDDPFLVDYLWQSFKADVCPTLAGKPKLFFIQACRGEKLDKGVKMMKSPSRTQVDSAATAYKIPSFADFLIAYSTVDGHYAWRSPEKGTWFIQCLCQELQENGRTMDVLKLMTRTARRVALDHESFNDLMPWQSEMKQVPMMTSMLIRDIYFRAKGSEQRAQAMEGVET